MVEVSDSSNTSASDTFATGARLAAAGQLRSKSQDASQGTSHGSDTLDDRFVTSADDGHALASGSLRSSASLSSDNGSDSAIDAPDKDFGRFDVWRDRNGNGAGDPGELSSLVDAGVRAISLASDGVQSRLPDGSTIYGQGSFTRTDGNTGRLADVALAFAPDISTARDQLVGAMAVGQGGPAGTTASIPPAVAAVGPMLAADAVSPLHARPA